MSDAINFREWLRARAAAASAQGHGGAPETATHPAHEHGASTNGHAAPATPAAPRNPVFPNLRPPWPKGVSGNPKGRPVHSRDRISEIFIRELGEDFEENGRDAVVRVRAGDPVAYLALVAKLVKPEDRTDRSTANSILARLGLAELAELRRQLEAAVAAARAGLPVQLPPMLEAHHEDPNR